MGETLEGYRVGTLDNEDWIWGLPANLMIELNLKEHQSVSLQFGSLSTYVRVRPMNLKELPDGIQMWLSKGVLKKLHIPENISLSVKPTSRQNLRLGPVIGILTFRHVLANRNFGFYLNYAKRFKNGLLYIFGSSDINTKTKTVTGYYFDSFTKTWKHCQFPCPDAVMDRCYPNAYRAHTRLERVIGKGKIFNKKTMLDKYDFYMALHKNRGLSDHLPETRLFQQASDLEYFLNKYREIFLKPVNGMKGRGIVTVASDDKNLVCRYMANGTATAEKITCLDQILAILKRAGLSRGQYIIQSGVPKMDYRGKPFAFRVILYKNGSGRWAVPAIFAKAAAAGGFLTNYSSGGRFILLKHLFNGIIGKLPCPKTEFINLMIDISLKTAEALDYEYGPLGKLGLDIVVDPAGKPWLIEANGNPGLVPLHALAEFPDWRYQVFEFPLAYAIYLAGFSNLHSDKYLT